MLKVFRRAGLLAASLVLVAGCAGDHLVAPSSPQSPAAGPSNSLLPSLTMVTGLQRTNGLASAITVTEVIGGAGGTLSIPAAGVMVTVPMGALIAPVTITMTARAGTLVAYDFAPHGITFAKPLVFTQALTGTNANLLTAPLMQLGYYADASLLTSTTAIVSELISAKVVLKTWKLTSTIPHFSGYAVSCGRE